MQTSEQINEIAAALAKAQGQIKAASKDSENPFFDSSYADLDSCWAVAQAPLSDNGIAVVQSPGGIAPHVKMVTRLIHSSGQWIESDTLEGVSDKTKPQDLGSLVTYLRRYQLCPMVGIRPKDDDDGNAASGKEPGSKKPQDKPQGKKPEPKKEAVLYRPLAKQLHSMGALKPEHADALLAFCLKQTLAEAKEWSQAAADSALEIIGNQIAERMKTIGGSLEEAHASILAEALEKASKK